MPEVRRLPNVNRPLRMWGRPVYQWALVLFAVLGSFMLFQVLWQQLLGAVVTSYVVLYVTGKIEEFLPGSSAKNLLQSIKDPFRATPQAEVNYPPPHVNVELLAQGGGTPKSKKQR